MLVFIFACGTLYEKHTTLPQSTPPPHITAIYVGVYATVSSATLLSQRNNVFWLLGIEAKCGILVEWIGLYPKIAKKSDICKAISLETHIMFCRGSGWYLYQCILLLHKYVQVSPLH